MPRVSRGARAVLEYLIPLYVLAVVVQVLLAGQGIFGAKGSKTIHALNAFVILGLLYPAHALSRPERPVERTVEVGTPGASTPE